MTRCGESDAPGRTYSVSVNVMVVTETLHTHIHIHTHNISWYTESRLNNASY